MLAQDLTTTNDGGGFFLFSGIGLVIWLAVLVIAVVSLWKIFTKMGQPGWAGIVPILNYVVIARLAGKDWWWGLLPLVPCIGFVFAIILLNELAKLFGQGVGFTVGLVLVPFVFLPILAFGQYQYQGPQEKVI